MSRNLTVHDLNLYSHCPRLFKYYQDNQIDSVQFYPHNDYIFQQACAWIFSTAIRTGSYPSYKRLDVMWARHVPKDLGLEQKTNTWLLLRKILNNIAPNLIPVYSHLQLRQIFKGVAVTTGCPVIVKEDEHIVPLLFCTDSFRYYKNDLQIRLCLDYCNKQFKSPYIAIYNISYDNAAIPRYSLYKDSLPYTDFEKTISLLARSVAHGPYHPIYKCNRKDCLNWHTCSL